MTMELNYQRRYSQIPLLVKLVTLLILVGGLAAGGAVGTTRQYLDHQIKRYFQIEKVDFGKTRSGGRGCSKDELSSLKQLGKEAGTAIYIAQLNTENQRELKQQLATVEERLEAINAEFSELTK